MPLEEDVLLFSVGTFWGGCPQCRRCFLAGVEYLRPDLLFLFRFFTGDLLEGMTGSQGLLQLCSSVFSLADSPDSFRRVCFCGADCGFEFSVGAGVGASFMPLEEDVSLFNVGTFWGGCPQCRRCFLAGVEYLRPDLFFFSDFFWFGFCQRY